MPFALRPRVLKAVYDEALRKIHAWEMPSEPIVAPQSVFRGKGLGRLVIRENGAIDKRFANDVFLKIDDQTSDRNRFSGSARNDKIRPWGGLYCSLQPPALVRELRHYAGPEIPRNTQNRLPSVARTLQGICIAKIRLSGRILAADLSPHNPGARKFVEEIGKAPAVQEAFHAAGGLAVTIWKDLFDGEDCSVGRGIALAAANSGIFQALRAASVRPSEIPGEPAGDNIVFFGNNGQSPNGLWIEQAYLFPLGAKPEVCPVEFVP